MANGANVFVLKEIMGHSSLTTTMKYTHLQAHDLQQQHARFSPVASLAVSRNSAKLGSSVVDKRWEFRMEPRS